jgi:hypothetical protein
MRTADDIVEYYKGMKDDFLGFTGEVLLVHLPADKVKQFCKPDADLSDWSPLPITNAGILDEMREYMEFAWGKVQDHRGISAGRSVEKMRAWLWILEDEELLDFSNVDENYRNYGAPILKAICEKYDFPIPEGDDVANMAKGHTCTPYCDEGCA